MNDEPKKKFDLFAELGEVPVSLLNEPIDFTVDFTVPEVETARDKAKRKWHMTQDGKDHERE